MTKSNLQTDIKIDKSNNALNIKREFSATKDKVWSAWIEPKLLDKWWAPEPMKASTKKMDFSKGGQRLYVMIDQNSDEHWCLGGLSFNYA